jgi:hypothetical protein
MYAVRFLPVSNSRPLFSLTPMLELPSLARRCQATSSGTSSRARPCGQRKGQHCPMRPVRPRGQAQPGGWGRLRRTRLSSVQRGPGAACCLPQQCPAAVHQRERDLKSRPAQQMEAWSEAESNQINNSSKSKSDVRASSSPPC